VSIFFRPHHSFRSTPNLHSVVLGEGEETIVDLIGAIEKNEDLESVAGIAFYKDEKVIRTTPRARIREVDKIALPSWDEVPLENYLEAGYGMSALGGRMMPMIASRGCPYECTFCSNPEMWGNRWISRDPRLLIDEIELWIRKYQVTHVDFYDLTAIVNREWTLEFCRMLIERDLDITWSLPSGTRSEALDSEVLLAMRSSGCNALTYAPESGSKRTLKSIKKQVDLPRMSRSIRSCVSLGISTKASIIFGFPDQTIGEIAESFWYMGKLAWIGVDDTAAVPFVPYPGSELYVQLVRNGRIDLSDQQSYELFLAKNVYSELASISSFSDHVSDLGLQVLVILGSLWFYSLSFLFRPWRVARLGWRLLNKKPVTMLERVVDNLFVNFFARGRKKSVVRSVDLGIR
jgi:anaerobic magnesium-protoporphyrin IX monomethyl ester cyclase